MSTEREIYDVCFGFLKFVTAMLTTGNSSSRHHHRSRGCPESGIERPTRSDECICGKSDSKSAEVLLARKLADGCH